MTSRPRARLALFVAVCALGCTAAPATAATTCSTAGSYAGTITSTPGLAGYWRLDDASGTTACEASGAHAGTYGGAVGLGATGALAGDTDTAATFDGASANVSVPASSTLNVADSFSVEAWVKRAAIGGSENQAIVSKQDQAWVLMFNPANQLVLRKSNTGDVVASTVTLTDTSGWHHVAVTKSGSAVHLYIDGRDVTGTPASRTMVDNTMPLAIGQSSDSAYFAGAIDEVALYRGALSASQVQAHQAAGAPPTAPPPVPAGDPVIAASGDIACAPDDASYNGGAGTSTKCRQASVAGLLSNSLAGILTLGDTQYEDGSLANFNKVYDFSWGGFKGITHPVPGNHEYYTSGASDYFDYFDGIGRTSGSAGKRGAGYYSYDIGSWHLIALNSNCGDVACTAGSAQEAWLRSDLAAHPAKCTLAYWHHPRFTSGGEGGGNSTFMSPIFKDLYNANADLVLSGHDHDYERFAPQNPSAKLDRTLGIREFVVGSGGKSHHAWGALAANSEVRNNATFGVLRLTLHKASYDWQFVPESGASFTDSGSGSCH